MPVAVSDLDGDPLPAAPLQIMQRQDASVRRIWDFLYVLDDVHPERPPVRSDPGQLGLQ